MDFNSIDSSIEQTESDVEAAVEKIESIENKEESIKNALNKLQGDIETSSVLSKTLSEHQAEKQELSEEIEKYRDIARNLEAQINETIEANNDSKSVLKELELLGEDVQEGLNIITDRQVLIEKCKEQLQLLMDKLDIAGFFSEYSSESNEETYASDDGKAARNAFVQWLDVSSWKSSESDTDSSSASAGASSSSGDPNKGSQQLEIRHTVDTGRDDGFLSFSSLWNKKKQEVFGDNYNAGEDGLVHIRNQILAGKIDSCVDEFGWKRKERFFTLEEDLKAINPNYYTDSGGITSDESWTRNCQRCVIALEARFRGADVKATARILDGTDTLPYMNHPNGWLSAFENAIPAKCSGTTGIDTGINVLKQMKSYGDGTRAIVRIQRCDTIKIKDSNGNTTPFAVEYVNGNPVVCDPVSRSPVDLSSYFPGRDFSEGVEVIEKHNKQKPDLKEYILVSKKDGKKLSTIEGHGGHVFTAIQKEGKTIFCDSQTGKLINNPGKYFVLAKREETYVVRVDNLRFTERAKDCCESIV